MHFWRSCLVALGMAAASAGAWAQSADLVLNHADSPDPGPAGGIFTYTLRIDNNGPNAAASVTLSDTLPVGSQFVSATPGGGGACTTPAVGSDGVINCTLGGLAFTQSVTVTVQVRLPTAGVWRNTASAGSATSDPNTTNNLNIFNDTTAVQAADLSVVATPSASNVVAGQNYSYGLVVSNGGPDVLAADNRQTVSFTVPAGSSITGVPTGTGWSCTPAAGYPVSSGSISCSRTGALAVGASANTITVPAVANVAGTVTAAFAVAAVKGDGTTMPDGDLSNNTTSVDVTSAPGSDAALTKTANAAVVAVGDTVIYTLTPRHNGGQPPGTAAPNTITVTDTLGANLTFVSATGAGWTCGVVGQVVTCTRTGPYTGGNFTDMPAITVTATAAATGTLGNTATIAIPDAEFDTANNTSAVNITASNEADLSLAKTASLNPVVPGQAFNYGLVVRNNGPLPVAAGQTLTINDTLPAGVSLTAAPSGTGWVCTAPGAYPANAAAISCTLTLAAPLAAGADAPALTIPAVLPGAASLTNTACVVLAGGGRTDSNNANDCGSATVTASGTQADLRLSKAVDHATRVAGQDLTYTLTVTNDGPNSSTNVTLSDALQELVNTGGFQSATPSQGSCTPNTATNGTAQNLSCNLGTLASGASATVQVVIRPSVDVTKTRTNTASVTSPDVGDPARGNNTASASSQVTAIVDITVGKTATPASVPAGAPITFVTTVRNAGPSTAQTVVMTDTLPANAAFINLVSISNGGTCSVVPTAGATGGQLKCSWASLTNGTQATVNYRMRPLGTAAGSTVVNNVAVTTTTAESDLTNNSATTTTAVTAAQLDILVNKVDSADPVDLGQMTTYTITINNSGPSYGTHVVLTDVFPAPGASPTAVFSYQGALTVNTGGSCTQPAVGATSGTLSCTFPGLDSGQTATVTYQMRAESLTVAGATSGTAFNKASVTVDETETTLANNAVQEATTARRNAIATDLQITKATTTVRARAGDTFAYTLTVKNNGPLASDGAQAIDTLPAGLTLVSAPSCVSAGSTVTCPVGTLAVGASRVFTLTVQVANPFSGASVSNTATVDAPGDTVPGNNTSMVTTPVDPSSVGVPTLSEWALILLAVLMGGLGWRAARVQRRA